jgi:hypothetical protein
LKRTVALCCLTALVVAGLVPAYGAARHLLTGKDIKNHSLKGVDIKKGSIPFAALSKGTRGKINARNVGGGSTPASQGERGQNGQNGQNGAPGANGLDSDFARTVTAGNLRGFTLAPKGDNGDTTDNGTLDFTTPPATPPLGTKSLEFKSTNGKPVVVYAGVPSSNAARPLLAELTKASYASLIHTQPQSSLDISMQFEVTGSTSTHFASGYTTVVFEPYQNQDSETLDEWHRHSVDFGKVWSTQASSSANPSHCTQATPCPLRQYIEENPHAQVLTAKLKIGQNSGTGWTGFDGFLDDVKLGFGPVTQYDFGG